MSENANKTIVRDIYGRLEQGDRSGFAEHASPELVWRFPSKATWSRRYEGLADIRDKLLGPLFHLFADVYTARAINLIAEGDIVVAEIEGHVLLKNGQVYDNQYCMLFRFGQGKIVEVVEYCDTDLEERVLGNYEAALTAFQAQSPRQTASDTSTEA